MRPANTQATVTVVLMTYNHEKWIAQAIDSILMQEVDFPIEVVVLEDCSTDRTREIILEKTAAHPNLFRLIFAQRNENSNATWMRVLRETTSPYVITIDGDDYWTSPQKLSRQVRFLDEHPECALCFHNINILDEVRGRSVFNTNPPDQKEVCTLEDLIEGNFVPTSSAMHAKRLVDPMPAWLETVEWGDWALVLHAASRGTVRYINEVMGVYRVHGAGYWSGMSEIRRCECNLDFYEKIKPVLDSQYDGMVRALIERLQNTLAQLRAALPKEGAQALSGC